MIGSSSARVKERLADGDVIVVEIIGEPLLARRLLGVFDISVCRVFVQHILEDEVDVQKEGQGDKREDGEEREESGVVEERAIRHNDHNALLGIVHTIYFILQILYSASKFQYSVLILD